MTVHGNDMDASVSATVTSVEQLRNLYRPPVKAVAEKKVDHVAPWGRAFISASPFFVLSTGDASGRPTASPKGGEPGFVAVLDDRHLAIPDYAGNNLIDSLRNLMVNPHVGLIFMIPGRGETLRVDGRAHVSTDPALLSRFADASRRPKTVIVVEVRELFVHCSAAMERAGLWDAASWRDDGDLPYRDFVVGELRRTLPTDELPDWAR